MGILPKSIPSQVNRNNHSSTQMIRLVGKTAERMKNEPFIMGAFHLRETEVRWSSCGVRLIQSPIPSLFTGVNLSLYFIF